MELEAALTLVEAEDLLPIKQGFRAREIVCRTALSKDPLPGLDYGLNPYVGCAHSCVSGDSWIATDEGFIKPEEMATQVVLCVHGQSYQQGSLGVTIQSAEGRAIASRVTFGGFRHCIRLSLENGLWLDVTPEHPLLVVREGVLQWIEAGTVTSSDYVAISLGANLWAKTGSGVDRETAWVIGYLVGDGCLPSDGRRLHFAVSPPERERLIQYFKSRYGYAPCVYSHTQSDKIENLWVYNKKIAIDFHRWVDPGNKLCVPKIIRESPRESVESFLEGLWAADGTTTKACVREIRQGKRIYRVKYPETTYLVTISPHLAHEVQVLLLNLGNKAVVQGRYKTKGFRSKLGQSSPRYYVLWRAGKQYDTIPLPYQLTYSTKYRKWYRIRLQRRRRGVNRETLAKAEPWHPLLRNDLFYVRVEALEAIGPRRVYDLEVPGPRSFTANHMVCRNCTFCYVPSLIHRPMEEWGSFVMIKRNVPTVLAHQVKQLPRGLVAISTATDPYQYLEGKYRLTRHCLEVLAQVDWPVSILTRSPLVFRDVDLFRRFSSFKVGFSIPTVDDEARKLLEPYAPSIRSRLRALRRLSDMGFETWISFAPAYPPTNGLTADAMADVLAATGIRTVHYRELDLKPGVRGLMLHALEGSPLRDELLHFTDRSVMEPFVARLGGALEARGVEFSHFWRRQRPMAAGPRPPATGP